MGSLEFIRPWKFVRKKKVKALKFASQVVDLNKLLLKGFRLHFMSNYAF